MGALRQRDAAGGSLTLADLLDEHAAALDHDLRPLGVDLCDLVAGRAPVGMTPGRVLWLVEQLPEGSAFHASAKGGLDHRAWTADRVLLAGIFNLLQGANYQRSGGKGRKPKPINPPEVKRKGRSGGRSRAAAYIARGVARARAQAPLPD